MIFTSDALRISSVGDIQPDGSYRLTTHKKHDGAIPGQYAVTVIEPEPEIRERARIRPPPIISPQYENSKASGLSASVEPKDNELNFQVRKHKAGRR